MTDRETIEIYDARARDYADLIERAEPDPQLTAFLAALPEGATVLDLGCGPGQAAAAMARAGHAVTALDASREMVVLAARHDGVTAIHAGFDDLPDGPFDGVWANFSLLHAPRPDLPRHLAALRARMPKGGVFHIGMKTGEGMARDGIGRRYTYVTQPELTQLLTKAGFSVMDATTGEDTGLDGVVAAWVCLRATAV